ncbi:MAG: hypothetical protein H6622_03665 [Halobacteriovoraceae bacterium]|nr:hypothetical protein [Halobacteriovoraceae bacterium]
MKAENFFILSAGLGTRMYEIGKILPKVAWPIFEKTLIELQILYAKKLGAKKIFINLHANCELLRQLILNKFSADKSIYILHEKILLDSGGAFHNLKKNYDLGNGLVFIMNADIFNFSKNLSNNIDLGDGKACLFSKKITKKNKYNKLLIKGDCLSGILSSSSLEGEYTYSGNGIVDMNQVEIIEGPSKFFQSVCNPEKDKIIIKHLEQQEYWDFGTSDLYYENIQKLCHIENVQNLALFDFLKASKAIITKNFQENSYYSENFKIAGQSIYLDGNDKREKDTGIYYKHVFNHYPH